MLRHVDSAQVPYGTSFHQNVQWACRYEGRGKCRLRVTGEVEFTKSPFVKGMIQKASEEVRSRPVPLVPSNQSVFTRVPCTAMPQPPAYLK